MFECFCCEISQLQHVVGSLILVMIERTLIAIVEFSSSGLCDRPTPPDRILFSGNTDHVTAKPRRCISTRVDVKGKAKVATCAVNYVPSNGHCTIRSFCFAVTAVLALSIAHRRLAKPSSIQRTDLSIDIEFGDPLSRNIAEFTSAVTGGKTSMPSDTTLEQYGEYLVLLGRLQLDDQLVAQDDLS